MDTKSLTEKLKSWRVTLFGDIIVDSVKLQIILLFFGVGSPVVVAGTGVSFEADIVGSVV